MRLRRAVSAAALCVLAGACGGEQPAPTHAGRRASALAQSGVRWEQKTPSESPPARIGHALVYDPVRGVTVAAGGRPVNDRGASLSDTWMWDGQTWTRVDARLPARGFIQGAFDTARRVSLIYGGLDMPAGAAAFFAQTYERAAGSWAPRAGTSGPRSHAALTYDARRGVSVMFGGFDGSAWLDDLWEWDGSVWTQRCAAVPCSTGARPSPRANAVFVYDAARGVTLLFGGDGRDGLRADTWTWDGSAWTLHSGTPVPSARRGSAAAYDPATQRIYLFGGATESGVRNDLWAWSGSAWHELSDSTAPSAREEARMAWDGARGRGVLFGGRANEQAVDFWEFSLVGSVCSSDDECPDGVCVNEVCGPRVEAASDAGAPGAAAGGRGATPGGDAGTPAAAGSTSSVPAPDAAAGGAGNAGSGQNRGSPRAESLYACTSSRGASARPECALLVGLAAAGLASRRRRPADPRRSS